MPVISKRAQAIDAYIAANKKCKVNDSWPMEFGGKIDYQPVYRIPIKLLCYNLNNGRYAMELAQEETDAGYKFDPTRIKDRARLRDLLLRLDPEQTALLKQDLAERGQIYPGVITQDGFVINANRRMAILEVLRAETGSNKYDDLLVQRLPAGVGPDDLWRLEAGLQLSRDTRADYSPVNELLKLRQGMKAKLSPKQIAAAMFGRSESWVIEALERLNIMEQYLDYFKWPEQYHRLNGTNEQFIELQKALKGMERDGIDAEERYRWLICTFQLIHAGVRNWDLRDLRKIVADDDAAQVLEEQVVDRAKPGKPLAADDVVTAYEAAQDTIKSKSETDRPSSLLHKAYVALSALDLKSQHLVNSKNKLTFRRIRQVVKKLESRFKST